MENKIRENNLKYLRELYKEFEKNRTSTLIIYDILNLEKQLGISSEEPISVNGLNGTFSYKLCLEGDKAGNPNVQE